MANSILQKTAETAAENLYLAKSAFNNFYFNAIKKLGELPLQGDRKDIKGMRIVTISLPFGKKGLEAVRAAAVTYDKVRYNDKTHELEFHVADGNILFPNNSWQTQFNVDFLSDISDCLLKAVVFPKDKCIVDIY